MLINQALIQDAMLRAAPETLDDVLDAIEAYRACAATARRLIRSPSMETQRQQMLECALLCEEKLAASVETGRVADLQYPEADLQAGHFILTMKW